ncbi:hypothetical protein [Thalassobaculum litoreum]|nr:hypothetical protein [Thalassobaculum litoreum]
MDTTKTAQRAIRAAVKAQQVPAGPVVEVRPTETGVHVVVLACGFPVVPREWAAWVDTPPSQRGDMPPALTTQAQAFCDAIIRAIQPALPGLSVTCDFSARAANPAGAETVKL